MKKVKVFILSIIALVMIVVTFSAVKVSAIMINTNDGTPNQGTAFAGINVTMTDYEYLANGYVPGVNGSYSQIAQHPLDPSEALTTTAGTSKDGFWVFGAFSWTDTFSLGQTYDPSALATMYVSQYNTLAPNGALTLGKDFLINGVQNSDGTTSVTFSLTWQGWIDVILWQQSQGFAMGTTSACHMQFQTSYGMSLAADTAGIYTHTAKIVVQTPFTTPIPAEVDPWLVNGSPVLTGNVIGFNSDGSQILVDAQNQVVNNQGAGGYGSALSPVLFDGGIKIHKTDETGNSLAGATFAISDSEADASAGKFYATDGNLYQTTLINGSLDTSMLPSGVEFLLQTTDDSGTAAFLGLQLTDTAASAGQGLNDTTSAKDYYAREIKAPTGYQLSETPTKATAYLTPQITTVTDEKAVGKVIVHYVDAQGNPLAADETMTGDEGSAYTTSAKKISGYKLVKTSANANGTYSDGTIEVTYTYQKVESSGGVTPPSTPNNPTNKQPVGGKTSTKLDSGNLLPLTGDQLTEISFFGSILLAIGAVLALRGKSRKYKHDVR